MKTKQLLILFVCIFAYANTYAANRYWVGGTAGTWDATNTSCWSISTGGTGGASVPGALDDVIFDNSAGNVSPKVYLSGGGAITVNSITFTSSNVTFPISFTQTNTNSVSTASFDITLSAPNANIKVGQTVTLAGTNAGTLAASTTVSAISGTTLTLNKKPTANSSATGTLTFAFAPSTITTTNMTAASSQVVFYDNVTVNSAITFSGTDPRITENSSAWGKTFTMGNGGAFTLTGHSATNYFGGKTSAAHTGYAFDTTSALTVYFDPSTPTPLNYGGLTVTKGLITLGNNVNMLRFMLSATNSQELILAPNVTLTAVGGGSSSLTASANGGVLNASASGSKVLIPSTNTGFLDGTKRFFKTGVVINHLELSAAATYNLYESIRVRQITKTAGTIATTELKTITVEAGGSIVDNGGAIGTDIIYETPVTRYWVGGAAGNWLNAASWGTSSGSTSTPGIPAYGDNVVFDNSTGNENPTVTLTDNVTAADISFTSSNVTFAGAFGITTPSMTVNSSQVVFVDNVTVNSAITFSGTTPRITQNSSAWGKTFTMGNGGAFTLTGHSATNYFGGKVSAAHTGYAFNTTSALTVYFDQNIALNLGGITVTKGLITLGNNVNIMRFVLSATNSQELILAPNVTLTVVGGGSSILTASANGGVVNASASGSKVLIPSTNTSILDGTKRFFKTGTVINHLEFSAAATYNLFESIRVRQITKTAGTIATTASKTITVEAGGSIVDNGGAIGTDIIYETPVTRYWVGGAAGNWLNAASWGTSSGNTSTPGIPAYGDNVVFDNSTGNENPTVTLTDNVTAADITFTSSNVTFAGAFTTTTNSMTANSSQVRFVDYVTVNSAITFSGTDPRITQASSTWGKHFKMGNGGAFTLTGNSPTNYFDGKLAGVTTGFLFDTSSALTAYFNPTTVFGGIIVTRGLITVGSNFNAGRITLSATNNQELIVGENTTFTMAGGGTHSYTTAANGGVINASAAGSKVLITTAHASVMTSTGRIFKDATTINHLEYNSAAVFNPTYAMTVKNLTLTSGTINNSTNNITIDTDGAINRTSGLLSAPPVFTGAINVNIGGTTSIAGNELLGTTGHVGTLTVNNGANYTLNAGSITVDDLTIAAGAQVTNSATLTATNLTINSNETGTGTFIDNSNSTITNAVVKQYLSSATARNWYMSSPVSGASALPANGGTLAFYSYPENDSRQELGVDGSYAAGAVWNTVSSGSMAVKTGYIVRPSDATSTLSFTGTGLNTGNQTISGLTYTAANPKHGFNLIGNPYPSYINVLPAINANANLEATVWYKTRATNGTYYAETVNAASGVGTDASGTGRVTGYIPPMQAFWVRATADNQSITLTNSDRSHAKTDVEMTGYPTTPTTSLKAPAAKQATYSLLGLKVSNGTNNDEAIVMFTAQAKSGLDTFDSGKMTNGNKNIPEIFTLVEGKQLAINGLGSISYDTEMPLGFTTGTAGTFSIKAAQISNFEGDTKVILKDYLDINQPVLTDLSDGSSYSFTSDATSNNTNRFSLLFRAPGVATIVDNATKLNSQVFVNANNQITIIAPEKSNYVIYNAVGMMLENGVLNSELQTINCKLQTGVFVVKVNNQSTRVIIK